MAAVAVAVVVTAVATVVAAVGAAVVAVATAVAENEWKTRNDSNLFCIVNQLLWLSNHSFQICKKEPTLKSKINLIC